MIYLDNAATSYPKPACMMKAMNRCIQDYCGNPGRSGHDFSIRTGLGVYETRRRLAELLGIHDPSRILFTSNTTEALNLGLKGILSAGDHVITTAMEHNSVLRPLKALEQKGVETTIISCDAKGFPDLGSMANAVRDNTKAIVCTHASNVTGTVMPIGEIAKLARRRGVLFVVDGAQTIGARELDCDAMGIDLLAGPGHKGLLGPQGTGFLYVRNGVAINPLKEGGTGTNSKERIQPREFPEGFEAGTLNAPGLIGLGAAIRWVMSVGVDAIRQHEEELMRLLQEDLGNVGGLTLFGPTDVQQRSGILTFALHNMDCEEVAHRLNKEFGIAVRAGYHCAGLAHKTIGTWDTGVVRISVGPYNTKSDMKHIVTAIHKLAKQAVTM